MNSFIVGDHTASLPNTEPHRSSILGRSCGTMGLAEVFIRTNEAYFDNVGAIDDNNKKFMQQWVDRYVAWVKLHATCSTRQA